MDRSAVSITLFHHVVLGYSLRFFSSPMNFRISLLYSTNFPRGSDMNYLNLLVDLGGTQIFTIQNFLAQPKDPLSIDLALLSSFYFIVLCIWGLAH